MSPRPSDPGSVQNSAAALAYPLWRAGQLAAMRHHAPSAYQYDGV